MPAPVISATQSILGFKQWEPFAFQPYATNGPGRWRHASALPMGLTLDPVSGRIAGPGELPGVFVIGLTAANGYEVTRIRCVPDVAGSLNGKYLVIPDAGGTVGVWIDVNNSGTAAPAHGATRGLEITGVSTGASAMQVAAAVEAVLSADPAWHVRRDGAVLWIYDAALGARTAAAAGSSGFDVVRQSAGAVAESVSAEQAFTIGIEPGPLVPDSLPWVSVDLVTGAISVDGEEINGLAAADHEKFGTPGFVPPFAFAVKEDDDLLARLTFHRGGTPQEISLDALRLVLKEFEPENVLVVSTEAFERQGSGSSTNFLLHAKFDGSALAGSLANYESDSGTFFFALAEIEYEQVNPESVGPATLVRTSQTFCIRIERDLAAN